MKRARIFPESESVSSSLAGSIGLRSSHLRREKGMGTQGFEP